MEFTTHFKLQSQATRLCKGASCGRVPPRHGILTLSDSLLPKDLSGGRSRWRLSRLQFGAARGRPDWRRELCPLHSPLLGASRLFSSPPLSDMLKFSGWPHVTPWRYVKSSRENCGAAGREAAGHRTLARAVPDDSMKLSTSAHILANAIRERARGRHLSRRRTEVRQRPRSERAGRARGGWWSHWRKCASSQKLKAPFAFKVSMIH